MEKKFFILRLLLVPFLLYPSFTSYGQQKISDKQYNFELKIPDSLVERENNDDVNDSLQVYYDSSPGIILMISGRKSVYTDIKSYLDCSKESLERELQSFQGDSTLKLVECRQSAYYPYRAVVLHFETSAYSSELNRCMIYFIHHKDHEIQFFFLYNKSNKESMGYIDNIMQTLVLL